MKLDAFTAAYIEAALWSSTADDGTPLDDNHDVNDIAPQTLAAMIADCQAFQAAHWDDIADNLTLAGHDYWLTRCRHGAGFWDSDWPADVGACLTAASHADGNIDLYVGDDGLVWG